MVEANIHYPTDASLLSDCVRVITRTVKQFKEQGVAVNTEFHNRTRFIRKRIYSIAKAKQVLAEVKQRILDQTNAAAGKVEQTVNSLEQTVEIAKRIIAQTVSVQQGNTHIKDRLVSIFDPDARSIVKGKLKVPTEFRMKLFIQDCEKKIITRYQLLEGNPNDDTLLIPAVDAHSTTFGCAPTSVATGPGFASPKNEAA